MRTNIRANPKRFLMGHDSEFAIFNRNKMAPIYGNINDLMGYDGLTAVTRTVEARSVPSECPVELINRLHDTFKKKIKQYPQVLNYNWQAGSFKINPIGMHQHYGVLEKDIKHETAAKIIGNISGALSLLIE